MVRIRRRPSRKLEALALLFCVAVIFVAERAIQVVDVEPDPAAEVVQPENG